MKKIMVIILCAAMLCGCSAAETFETVADEYVQSVMQPQYSFSVSVEDGATVVTGAAGTIYLCDGYEVTVQVLSSGNLDATLQTLTGFKKDGLALIETSDSGMSRFECVWTAAGESGDIVGRAVIFDDGTHHYCVSVIGDAEDAQALLPAWNAIVDSVVFA